MGYTLTLVASPPRPIGWDELAQAGLALGWQVHAPEQELRLELGGRLLARVTLDLGEASATNPQDLAALIALATRLGLRLRGDDGESYRSPTETWLHPDDAAQAAPAPARPRNTAALWRLGLLLLCLAGFGLKIWLDHH